MLHYVSDLSGESSQIDLKFAEEDRVKEREKDDIGLLIYIVNICSAMLCYDSITCQPHLSNPHSGSPIRFSNPNLYRLALPKTATINNQSNLIYAFCPAPSLAFFCLLLAGETFSLTVFIPPKYNQLHTNTTAKLNPQKATSTP